MKVQIFIALKSFEAKQLSNLGTPGFQHFVEPGLLVRSRSKTISNQESSESIRINRIQRSLVPNGSQSQLRCATSKIGIKKNSLMKVKDIALPKTQSNYTVLRSPHIDKKSRDQFEFKIHKKLIIISTEINQIREKLFKLKFHEMAGVQMKVIFQTKTRLNCGKVLASVPVK